MGKQLPTPEARRVVSFRLSEDEVARIDRLKRRFRKRDRTALIRMALQRLEATPKISAA